MRSAEIARRFLDHFAARGHEVVPSASLIADDPTLLLVNAGMVPFKPYLLGEVAPPYPRATSVQKCVRTVDIDNVGATTRHGTFFQMCGNFSFGDYFKSEAISYAWELLTSPTGFALAEDRLWVTVFTDDDEAYALWRGIGVDPGRIQRRGREHNFWSMGVPGPCGPDSEICYDRGPRYGREGGPVADEERYLEIWNLVFMAYRRGPGEGENYEILGELPAHNIDTGLGLERLAVLLQGVENFYEIDLLRPVLDRAAELTGSRYGRNAASDVHLRIVAEHARTAAMLIGDGVLPANEGRGYVLRRLLRRAARHARLLGAGEPVLAELARVAVSLMAESYPELGADTERIVAYVAAEEAAFLDTLRAGSTLFTSAAREAATAGGQISGERAFALHDTYGFPIELTLEMAREAGLSVDTAQFTRLMAEQRRRGKADRAARGIGHRDVAIYRSIREQVPATRFTGYGALEGVADVRALLVDGQPVGEAGEGAEVEVVLTQTPFYAEAGGQEPDRGWLRHADTAVEVLDVQNALPGLVVHRGRVRGGVLRRGDEVSAQVDPERRLAISRSHTATHLLHQALRDALGPDATQAGSANSPGRLRFDFASPHPVSGSVLREVEERVNAVALSDLEVHSYTTDLTSARAQGAMALFGEKYGDVVRVVEVGEFTRELCGGTHVARSTQLGSVAVLAESSIGAGVRRIEALVGLDAFRHLARAHVLAGGVADALKVSVEELPERVEALVERLRQAERSLTALQAAAARAQAGELATGARSFPGGLAVVAAEVPGALAGDQLRQLALDVRARLGETRPVLVALATRDAEAARLVVATTAPARALGLRAGSLVRLATAALGGRGGGRDDLAQGGGPDVQAVPAALAALAAALPAALSATDR